MNNKQEFILISNIITRAEKLNIADPNKRVTSFMDVDNAHKKFNMDLLRWSQANDFEFAHDFLGIRNNINRDNPNDFGLFVPRFANN